MQVPVASAGAQARSESLDAPSAVEFMREALIKISEDEISVVAAELEARRTAMAPRLEAACLTDGVTTDLRPLLRGIFATRRRADAILEDVGGGRLGAALHDLVYLDAPVAERFASFDRSLEEIEAPVRRDLGSECLRAHDPDRYWLWTRWMWDPKTSTGALPLVLVDGYDLQGPGAGEIYAKVGEATRAVMTTADAIGFKRMKDSRYAVDVYLAAIYGVYLYTVTRMRMTQEFNRVIPKLPELVRRLLGVHRAEARA